MKLAAEEWAAVSPLFDAALDQPPEQRVRWLDALPAEQQALRSLLERLLADHARVESAGFMGVPPLQLAAEALEEQIPATVGPYRLLRELGRGGMGRVWLAEPADGPLKRQVAIKLPHPGLATRAFAERLARERDILASLTHPHIARLYDAGISADGQPYIALEYVEGRDLIAACDTRRLGPRARIELFMQVLSAVQYAHAHLVIHRDLKPSNVLVDAEGQVRLLDFGVAKLLIDGLGEATELTLDAGAALTPDFAAPEQLLGQPLGTASDIYALGVLLYELLSGRRPYHLMRQERAAMAQTLLALDLPRPSAAAARDEAAAAARGSTPKALARTLRGDLDTIVLKALKPRPEQRYESATAFQADLQRYLRGEPVLARPDGAAYRLRRFVTRNRWAVAGAALGVTAISVAAVGYAIEAREARAERDYARVQADRSDAVTRFLNDLLVEASQAQRAISVGDLVARSEKLIATGYRDNPEHRAAVMDTLAMYHATMGNFGKANQLMQQALAAAAGSTDPALIDQLRCSHAFTVSKLGQVEAAKQELQEVLAHPSRDPRVRVICVLYRGFIAHDNHDAKGSLADAQLALQLLRAQREPMRELEAELLANLGTAYQDNARPLEADRYFAEAMRQYAEIGRERGPVAMTVRNNLATLRSDMGVPAAALALLDEALAIARGDDGASRPPVYLALNRAHTLRALGRYADARAAYELARGVAREQDDASAETSALIGMAGVAREQSDLATAGQRLEEARALADARLKPTSPMRARLEFETASLLQARGQAAAALEAFGAVLKRPLQRGTEAAALLGRADGALQLGRLDAALADTQQSLALAEALRGGAPYSWRSGAAQLELARVQRARGDAAAAAAALKAAGEHLSHTVDAAQWQRASAEALLRDSVPH